MEKGNKQFIEITTYFDFDDEVDSKIATEFATHLQKKVSDSFPGVNVTVKIGEVEDVNVIGFENSFETKESLETFIEDCCMEFLDKNGII